jgi:hypothetical protein
LENILSPIFQNNSIAIIDPDLMPKEGDCVNLPQGNFKEVKADLKII